ncbi:MAG: hypothetical protein QME64_04825 [bacterium]|nr:hypothetical protein [bacterium]
MQEGIAICTESTDQKFNNTNITDAIISDGNGNYVIAWQDYRNGNWDIYAQKITSQGSTLWAINGIAVCTVNTNQCSPALVSDGAGGAIIAWQDWRNDYSYNSSRSDIYVQRINNDGVQLWPLSGVSVCTAEWTQNSQMLISDGNNGAIIAWKDFRYPFQIPTGDWPPTYLYDCNGNVYAQRIDSIGNPLWTNNGVRITWDFYDFGIQNTPYIIPDGDGGAFIACQHIISLSMFGERAFANILRINSSGSTLWSSSMMTTDYPFACMPLITPDGNNGVLVAFEGYFINNWEIRGQRIDSSGTVLWPINGVTICTSLNNDFWNRIFSISDGMGGAIITWGNYDTSSPPYLYLDIFAQRINSIGSTLWTSNGIPICTAGYDQENQNMVSDMANGAILVWQDSRNGIDSDIYAQRVYAGGYVISPVNVPKELWDFEP